NANLGGLGGAAVGARPASPPGAVAAVEPRLVVVALVLGGHEAGIGTLEKPIQPQAHVSLTRLRRCGRDERNDHQAGSGNRADERSSDGGAMVGHARFSLVLPGSKSPAMRPGELTLRSTGNSISMPCGA